MYYLYSFPDNGIKYRDKMLWFCEIRIKIPEILYQFINIRKWFKASFQDSCDPGDQNTVICNRNVLILTAGNPVFHLSFIQHTAAAVYNQFVILQITRKFCSGGENKLRFFFCIASDPVRDFYGSISFIQIKIIDNDYLK